MRNFTITQRVCTLNVAIQKRMMEISGNFGYLILSESEDD